MPGVYVAGDVSRDVLLIAVALPEGAKAAVAIIARAGRGWPHLTAGSADLGRRRRSELLLPSVIRAPSSYASSQIEYTTQGKGIFRTGSPRNHSDRMGSSTLQIFICHAFKRV